MNVIPNREDPKFPSLINKFINERKTIMKNIYKLFHKKYSETPTDFYSIIIDNIIYNEKSHIVATFKDRLIIDDTGEFLKRYYRMEESDIRLEKFYKYYELYSKIFPNYTAFNEGKYLYQNIQRKQRMIDLQEKMELERKKKLEKSESNSLDTESKENVFNTEVVDSILNATPNESINSLFDIKKGDINEEEETFEKGINNIIEEINQYEKRKNKKGKENKIIKLDKNKSAKNNIQIDFNQVINLNNILNHNNNNNIFIHSNINNNRIGTFKEIISNKNIAGPININYTNNKRMLNSHSSSIIINNNNTTYYNDIRNIVNKYFNYPSNQNNIFLNFDNRSNKNNKMDELEKNLFKMKQKTLLFQKNSSQNISTTNQTQKDASLSKKNSHILYNKISTAYSSMKQNPNNIRKNINNFSSCKNKRNNETQNIQKIEKRNKGLTPLTSRNPKSNKLGMKSGKANSNKNIQGNTYSIADIISRNKYTNNMKIQNKIKSSILGSGFNQLTKMNKSQNHKPNQKQLLNNEKLKLSETKQKVGYKEINSLRNQNSKNKNDIKKKILNSGNGFNLNNSRNHSMKSLIKNNSKTNFVNNKKKNSNDSSLKLGFLDIMNIKKNLALGFNIKKFSKVLNVSNNNNQKNHFAKTYREKNILINK